jgi:hypothetical protein
MNRTKAVRLVLSAALLGLIPAGNSGCSSTSMAIKEKFGYAKREQLVDKVESARDGQQEAKQQFESALQEFLSVTGTSGGDLEAKYNKLKKEYERSESRASTVRSRIADVERVGEALFKEWKQELGQYSNESLRRASEQQLSTTRGQYDKLVGVMKAASGKMDPVLTAFKDQVLFLKHNLNAQAISSLQTTATQIQGDVSALVRDMEASIAEANSFIQQMQAAK